MKVQKKNGVVAGNLKKHVETYAVPSDVASFVQQIHELDCAHQESFPCRFEGCEKTFVFHSRRVSFLIRFEFVKSSGSHIVPVQVPRGQERNARVMTHIRAGTLVYTSIGSSEF